MKIIKTLILLGVAYGGYVYYQRYQAATNIASGMGSGGGSYSFGGDAPLSTAGGIGEVGTLDKPQKKTLPLNSGGRKKVNPHILPLLKAASKGDTEKVIDLLTKVSPDVRDSNRRTPLIHAAWQGHKEVCTKLLAAGANIKFQDRQGFNALHYAAGRGQTAMVEYLLNITATKDNKHYAAYARLMASVLTNHLASMPAANTELSFVNQMSPEGSSPIHTAASNGYVPMAKRLVSQGADVNLKNPSKQTPLHWASWNNRSDMIRYLITQKAKINSQDKPGNTPLMMAVQNNHADAVKTLLAAGAQRNTKNDRGQTALMIAIDKGHKDLLPLLQ